MCFKVTSLSLHDPHCHYPNKRGLMTLFSMLKIWIFVFIKIRQMCFVTLVCQDWSDPLIPYLPLSNYSCAPYWQYLGPILITINHYRTENINRKMAKKIYRELLSSSYTVWDRLSQTFHKILETVDLHQRLSPDWSSFGYSYIPTKPSTYHFRCRIMRQNLILQWLKQ